MKVYDELRARGLIAQTTGESEVREMVNGGAAVFYVGFDPTADSLTVGHFVPLIVMRHLQKAGNKPIALIGGGTTLVGDPTDKTEMRRVMTPETIERNAECFRRQMTRFLDFSEGGAIMVNNADWLTKLNYVDFLRDVGVHFSVNRMLAAECYKSRLQKGLSFLEFNYMLMQSYDYLLLHERYGCNLQCGGDDQWSNMLGGTELIRRKLGRDAHTLTLTLLLTSSGGKMGKTAKGAVWLDPEKTPPHDFYQYFRNTDDADVIPYLKRLTFVPLDEIAAMEHWRGERLNEAKERLAYELTALCHGKGEAEKAKETARALFSGGPGEGDMPSTTLCGGGTLLTDILVACSLVASKSEARRLITQGGVEVDGQRVTDPLADLADKRGAGSCVIRKGKKIYHKVVFT
ncbi:MAG: tyrosine--tRNA ligase [Oscillospiraceae bacterium]|jgi:tyrosyl-tRNA synthetase|nr:tyrosine--tRNA ligase [Oscillospiraceae bacterium]